MKVFVKCAILFLSSVIVSCSTLQVVPDKITNSEISFDGNDQNAGIYDFTAKGWHISESAAKRYVSLSAKYGSSLTPVLEKGEGLIIDPPNYYLPQQYMVKFATLNQRNRDGWR
jgi:hypothetical protein